MRMRLEMKTKMEADYIEEHERLLEVIEELRHRVNEVNCQPVDFSVADITTSFVEKTTNPILSEIEDLHSKISELETENRRLLEQIDIMEISKDTVSLNSS